MDRIKRYSKHGVKTVFIECEPYEKVREGLAYTPSQIASLTARGLPVNSLNTQSAFFDGTENATSFIPSDRQRHVDVADLWEEQQTIREKARKAAKELNKQKK